MGYHCYYSTYLKRQLPRPKLLPGVALFADDHLNYAVVDYSVCMRLQLGSTSLLINNSFLLIICHLFYEDVNYESFRSCFQYHVFFKNSKVRLSVMSDTSPRNHTKRYWTSELSLHTLEIA